MFSDLLKPKGQLDRMPILGSRELEVLDILWGLPDTMLSAQDVLNALTSQKRVHDDSISINTVQSTLERLIKKQLLKRTKIGRAFFYTTLVPKKQLIGGLIRNIAQDMSCSDMHLMISGFMDFIEAQDPELSVKLGNALHDVEHAKTTINDD